MCLWLLQHAVLTGLPQPGGTQSSRKPRVSEIWGYKRWLAIYQNITLIQLFKQRCIRQNSCLGPVGNGLTQPSRSWQRQPWGCISSTLISVTTSRVRHHFSCWELLLPIGLLRFPAESASGFNTFKSKRGQAKGTAKRVYYKYLKFLVY